MQSLFPLFRGVLRYRTALVLSIACSLMVGVLWGANFGALYPILKVVFDGESIQELIERKATEAKAEVAALEALPPGGLQRQSQLVKAKKEHQGWVAAADASRKYLPQNAFATLVLVLAVLLGATMLRGVFYACNEILVSRIAQRMVHQLRLNFYRRTLNLDTAQLGDDRTSRLMASFTHDLARLENGMESMLGQSIREPLKMLVCLAGAAFVSWRLLLVAMLIILPSFVLIRFLSRSLKRSIEAAMQGVPQMYAQLEQSFATVKLVKIFNMERTERSRFSKICKGLVRRQRRMIAFRAMLQPSIESLSTLSISISVLAGAYLVMNQTTHLFAVRVVSRPMEPATLIIFYTLLLGATEPLKRLSTIMFAMRRISVSWARVSRMMDREPRIVSPDSPTPLPQTISDLSFSKVTFRYRGGPSILKNMSCNFRRGEMVAVLGPNGCGKSTLINLGPRLYDPKRGEVAINGVDLRDFRLAELRKRIAVVPQETLLFDESVYDNILYARPDAAEEEVFTAAKLVGADDFIRNRLSEGYDTIIGERGSFLSGGQRQRIALARAMLREPDILILDEATSEIDAASEEAIFRMLAEQASERVTVFITHRPAVLPLAHRILVIDEGRVLAEGTHEELLNDCSYYQHLCQPKQATGAAA